MKIMAGIFCLATAKTELSTKENDDVKRRRLIANYLQGQKHFL